MTNAASNNVKEILSQLVDEGTLRVEHRKKILEVHSERRQKLKDEYKGKIWHAPAEARHGILSGHVAVTLSTDLGVILTPEVLTEALHRQQLYRIAAAKQDIQTAINGEEPLFHSWVANLRQSMYSKPNRDDRMVAIGDLAREMAVIAAHNPKVQTLFLQHLDTLKHVLEEIHFNGSTSDIKKSLHNVLDSLTELSKKGDISVLDVYDDQGQRKQMTAADLDQFVNDTRFMVTG